MHYPIAPEIVLRALTAADAQALADYFDCLSPESRGRFQPHPLTREAARAICADPAPSAIRTVLESRGRIVGYFIMERALSVHEADRYRPFGIVLEPGQDLLFAPSVADAYQGLGLASLAMPHLLDLARRAGARSLVLMGGTQETNPRAIAFYEKHGFQPFGGYRTEVYNRDMRLILGGG